MQTFHLKDMVKGWLIGHFSPCVFQTTQFEMAVKKHRQGETEDWHYHKIAREITVVVDGQIEMCGKTFCAGDIVVLDPGEGSSFRALTDTVNVIIKIPSIPNDKFFAL